MDQNRERNLHKDCTILWICLALSPCALEEYFQLSSVNYANTVGGILHICSFKSRIT